MILASLTISLSRGVRYIVSRIFYIISNAAAGTRRRYIAIAIDIDWTVTKNGVQREYTIAPVCPPFCTPLLYMFFQFSKLHVCKKDLAAFNPLLNSAS